MRHRNRAERIKTSSIPRAEEKGKKNQEETEGDNIKEEAEGEKKLIYVRTSREAGPSEGFGFYVINPHFADGALSFLVYHDIEKGIPSELLLLHGYANAGSESMIYFIGGLYIKSESTRYSDGVYAFDTKNKSWVLGLNRMLSVRACAKAVTLDNKIYVFGSFGGLCNFLEPEEWGECYNIDTNEWTHLPPPPTEVHSSYHVTSAIVYNGDTILLCFPLLRAAYSFHPGTGVWKSHDVPPPVCPLSGEEFDMIPSWSCKPTSHCHIALWEYCGTIFGYNPMETTTHPLYTFPEPYLDDSDGHTFLVAAGDGRLCLIWTELFDSTLNHCFTLRITPGLGVNIPRLVRGASCSLRHSDRQFVEDVFAL